MWQNSKYYLLAYAIMVAGALSATGLQLLATQFPTGHPVSTLSVNLSGITVGGLFMVIGFLKDDRVEQERERTKEERERADRERGRADQERERADQAWERADHAIAELNRLRAEYENATKALIQRLEELNGTPNTDADPAE